MRNICSIYKIVNEINGKVYIGQTWQTLSKRFAFHKKPSNISCPKLHNAFDKYGRDKFIIELLTVCHTQETSDYWEIFFINKFNSIENGYNLKEGGFHGQHSEESKRKIGTLNKGRIPSQETRKKISLAVSGERNPQFGIPSWNKNIPRTEKDKDAISTAKRKLNDDQINLIKNDERPQDVIAKEYGVSRSTISNIKRNNLRYLK